MGDRKRGFFQALERGNPACYEDANLMFAVGLRRELSEDEFALEPLGLARKYGSLFRLPSMCA